MGSPTRPSLAPMPVLAAVARAHRVAQGRHARRARGARRHDDAGRAASRRWRRSRPVASSPALGTGDELSKDEQIAYDVGYPTAEERWALLAEAMAALQGKVDDVVRRGTSRDRTRGARATARRSTSGARRPQRVARDGDDAARSIGRDPSKVTSRRRSINFATRARPGRSPRLPTPTSRRTREVASRAPDSLRFIDGVSSHHGPAARTSSHRSTG